MIQSLEVCTRRSKKEKLRISGSCHTHGILSSRIFEETYVRFSLPHFAVREIVHVRQMTLGLIYSLYLIPSLMLSISCGFLLVKQFENRIHIFNIKSFFSFFMIDIGNFTINVLSRLLPEMRFSITSV